MIPRSYLFVPGNRPERFAKALQAGADRVVLDLEDAVGPADKASARAHVAEALSRGDARLVVRINALGSPWFEQDVALCAAGRPAAVMLPKAESADHVAELHARTGARVLALIETARGLARARAVAAAAGVERLVFGSLDFQLDLGLSAGEEELLPYRCELVLASRLAGLATPVDGVTPALDDERLLREEAARSARLGFGAKLCIHPRQVGAVHAAFSPSPQRVAWARRVVEAVAHGQGNAVALDGAMVDLPLIEQARRVLAAASDASKGMEVSQSPGRCEAGGGLQDGPKSGCLWLPAPRPGWGHRLKRHGRRAVPPPQSSPRGGGS